MLQQQATDILARLIAFNTVNPPGNELPALEYLRGLLEPAGFECTVLGPEPQRQNLVARLRGRGDGPVLCYLSHVDTVLADAEDWQRDPWSGEVDADGVLWGRGALDMKGQTAAEVAAAVALAREGWRPEEGDLLIVAVCDEETGGGLGARWLTEEHPDLVRCDYLLNEGGGAVIPYGDRRLYGVCCGEKGTFRFTVTTSGMAGHAAIPGLGDNALLKLAPLLARFGGGQPGYDVTDVALAWLRTLLGDDVDGDFPAAVERVRKTDPRLATLLEPTLGVTVVPTRISASEKINVTPARAELRVDCRVPPGLGEEQARQRIAEVLGEPDGSYELEFTEKVVGNSSAVQGPLMDAIGDWIDEQDPGAEAVPVILPAFTDSRWFRTAFPDVIAYGFFPMRHMDLYTGWPLIHSADERIDVRDLGFATRFFYDVAKRLLGG